MTIKEALEALRKNYGCLTTTGCGSLGNLCDRCEYDVDLSSGRYAVDAKSIMGIFSLDLSNPIDLTAHTDNADKFFAEIEKFIVK